MSDIEPTTPLGVERDNSETLGKLFGALAKAQGQMKPAAKGSFNPHFKSRFADLASVWEACRLPLSANELTVLQSVSSGESGVVICTWLGHSSGEWVRDRCLFPVKEKSAQALGSAITYGRRYALCAMVGVVSDDEDDGNAASGVAGERQGGGLGATSRAAQMKASMRERAVPEGARRTGPEAWPLIQELMSRHGKVGEEAARLIKEKTGKPDRHSLTLQDYERLCELLEGPALTAASG